jgi:hypothetical protein
MALFLSFLLLGSQMGFAVSVHYCGGHISESSISLMEAKLGCGMESMEAVCETANTENQLSEKSCCRDQSQLIQVEDDFNQKQKLSKDQISFVQLFTLISNGIVVLDQESISPIQPSPPPLVKNNAQVLFQTFLI